MSVGNPASGSLFRSLGADDSYFETRARAASKEAEQRWPLFKAVAPNQAKETPELSAQQRQAAWTAPSPDASPAKAPRLSRPGLGQKLASGLRELSQKTKQEIAAPSPTEPVQTPPARSLRGNTLPRQAMAPVPEPATPTPTGTTPTPPPLFRPAAAPGAQPGQDAPRQALPTPTPSNSLFGTMSPAGSQVAASRKTAPPRSTQATVRPSQEMPRPAQTKKGLFAQLATSAEPARNATAPVTTNALQDVFNRLNAEAASPQAATKKRGSLFARIAR